MCALQSGEDPLCINSCPPERLSHNDHDQYLGHVMWCCHTDQPAFDYDLASGPFSPRNDWRTASAQGADTMCDYPFGCSNCDCGASGPPGEQTGAPW